MPQILVSCLTISQRYLSSYGSCLYDEPQWLILLVPPGVKLKTGRGTTVDGPVHPKLLAEKLNEGNDRLWKLIE